MLIFTPTFKFHTEKIHKISAKGLPSAFDVSFVTTFFQSHILINLVMTKIKGNRIGGPDRYLSW